MNQTKIQFSNSEMELMCNSEIILTKNKVIEKVKTLFAELQNNLIDNYEQNANLFPGNIFSVTPKISKGENYQGLPYLILDYPRIFKQEDIFAIRTMFWWGNFFSITLHLAGLFKLQHAQKIITSFDLLKQYSLGINIDPWLHHFDPDNYTLIASLDNQTFEEKCNKHPHLKIAKRFLLDDRNVSEKLTKSWKQITKICFD